MSTDAQIAESSTAIEVTEAAAPSLPVSRQQRQDFLKAANEPLPSQTEEIDTSKTSASKDESAPPPDGGKSGPKGKLSTSERAKQLEAENKSLSEQLARRKQLRADLDALEKPEPKPDAKVAPSPAAKAETAPEGRPVRPPKPKAEDFADWDKYQAALGEHDDKLDKYQEDLTDWKADQKLKGYDEKQTRAQQQRTSEEKWLPKIQASIEKHADYLAVVGELQEKKLITPFLDRFATKSEHGSELLYRIGEDLEFAKKLAQMDDIDATRELITLESEFTTDQAKTDPKRSPKLVSTAPRPERVLNGGGTAPDLDAQLNSALASGDVARYRQLKRQQEAAAHKTR